MGLCRRVVLVDDHADFRDSMRAWLAHEGFDVVGVAADGAACIRLAAETTPHLVLLDLHLPDRSGVDVADDLATLVPAPAVILISSDDEAADDPAVRSAPVSGFLAKRDVACAAIDALLA